MQSKLIEIEQIITQIENTSSRNEKIRLLKENKDNETLQKVLEYTYNPYKIYGFGKKSLEGIEDLGINMVKSKFTNIFSMLDHLVANNINDKIREEVILFLSTTPNILRNLYVKMILKDIRAGITESSINKVWKGLVPKFKVMLAKKYTDYKDKLDEVLAVTMKMEDIRTVILKEDGEIDIRTRQGKKVERCIELLQEIEKLPDNMVYDGGVMKINTGNLSRVDLFAQTRKVMAAKGDKTGIEFHVYDMLPIDEFKAGKSKDNFLKRKEDIKTILDNGNFKFLKEVPLLYVGKDKEVIDEIFKKAINDGEEGVMVSLDKPYECKRSKNILKVKEFKVADLLVLDTIEGQGMNEGKLGAITVKFEHGGNSYTCNCGSGFSQEERVLYYNNPHLLMNKIVEIGYTDITENDNGGFGLRFPIWKSHIRDDKTEISMY